MRIEQDMTIYTAAELKPRLLAMVAETDASDLDLSGVGEIDSAGVQLLLLVRREAERAGRRLRLVGESPSVTEVLKLVGYCADDKADEPRLEGAGA